MAVNPVLVLQLVCYLDLEQAASPSTTSLTDRGTAKPFTRGGFSASHMYGVGHSRSLSWSLPLAMTSKSRCISAKYPSPILGIYLFGQSAQITVLSSLAVMSGR